MVLSRVFRKTRTRTACRTLQQWECNTQASHSIPVERKWTPKFRRRRNRSSQHRDEKRPTSFRFRSRPWNCAGVGAHIVGSWRLFQGGRVAGQVGRGAAITKFSHSTRSSCWGRWSAGVFASNLSGADHRPVGLSSYSACGSPIQRYCSDTLVRHSHDATSEADHPTNVLRPSTDTGRGRYDLLCRRV